MALPAEFLEELRARTPLASLIGRRVRLVRSGKQFKGCCPFHGEKTPSFYVYDDGYHCFGCGAHGDAISFAMQTQGSSFIDAVTSLAAEAGLEVPAPSPAAARAEERRHTANSALEAALVYYRSQLSAPGGREAREYLQNRGLTLDTIAQFGLGWSGPGRGALVEELRHQGIELATIEAAGLLRENESGEKRELFFNRVMFPIRDRRGRLVSFGGRILGPGQPKYVNGPETELFSKRRMLYGLDQAREPVRGGADMLVVEGYMDVIALHQAGFGGAVAPLGTSLTEEQIQELWQVSPAPILFFDGDAAGSKATARALSLAIPHLTPDQTIRRVLLPSGFDPDSLIQAKGPHAIRALIKGASSAVEAIFDQLKTETGSGTPDARARLHTRIVTEASRIQDRSLASEYRFEMLRQYFQTRAPKWSQLKSPAHKHPRPSLWERADLERAVILTAALINHPDIWHQIDEAFHQLELPPWLSGLRTEIFRILEANDGIDSEGLFSRLSASEWESSLGRVYLGVPLKHPICIRYDALPADVMKAWWHFYGLLRNSYLAAEISVLTARELSETTQSQLIATRRSQLAIRLDPDSDEKLDE